MTEKTKNGLKGILWSLLAAYGFAVYLTIKWSFQYFESSHGYDFSSGLFWYRRVEEIISTPPFIMLYAIWFIIPGGWILGIKIPRVTRNLTHKESIKYGIKVGAIFGIIGGILISSFILEIDTFLAFFKMSSITVTDWTSRWIEYIKRTLIFSCQFTLYCILWVTFYSHKKCIQQQEIAK